MSTISGIREHYAAAMAKFKTMPCEQIYAELRWIAWAHGFKPGWVAFKFREIYSSWPNRMEHIEPEIPSVELQEWVYNGRELRAREASKQKAREKRLHPREEAQPESPVE